MTFAALWCGGLHSIVGTKRNQIKMKREQLLCYNIFQFSVKWVQIHFIGFNKPKIGRHKWCENKNRYFSESDEWRTLPTIVNWYKALEIEVNCMTKMYKVYLKDLKMDWNGKCSLYS